MLRWHVLIPTKKKKKNASVFWKRHRDYMRGAATFVQLPPFSTSQLFSCKRSEFASGISAVLWCHVFFFFFKPALAAPLHRSPSYVIQNLPNMPFLQSCLAGGVTSGLPIPSSGIPKKNVEAFLIVGTLVKAIDRLAAKKCKAIWKIWVSWKWAWI